MLSLHVELGYYITYDQDNESTELAQGKRKPTCILVPRYTESLISRSNKLI